MSRVVWRHKVIVAVVTALTVAVSVYLALTATPIFRATVVLTVVRESAVGGAGALAGQLGSLASIAGLSLGSAGEDRERQAVLESRYLIEEFVRRNSLQEALLHGSKQRSSLWNAVERFSRSVVNINEDKLKGTTTITMDWTDPHTAAEWANAYVALCNEILRSRAIDDASRSVDYLNKQIAETNVIEVQRVMYNLIEEETKTLMLANARREYAFTVVDPAVAPEQRISPRRTLMVLGGDSGCHR